MPPEKLNPDIAALAAGIQTELVFGQVLIRRDRDGFELRHVADRSSPAGGLRLLADGEIRPLAQFSSSGAFRPLKSAPNLPAGWRVAARDERALGTALHHLYPGAVADWFAAQSAPPPVTSYRQFTARQTGMYRLTTHLDDATAGAMTRACCHPDFCLKRRLWTVGAEAGDDPFRQERHPVPGAMRHPARIRPPNRAPGPAAGSPRRARALRDDARLPGRGMRFCGPQQPAPVAI